MHSYQILSRRRSKGKVDFRPDDPDGKSPYAQLRHFARLLEGVDPLPLEDPADLDDALDAYREFLYRKIFGGTTHDDFLALDSEDPQRIDWLLAVAAKDTEHFRNTKKSTS